MFTAYERKPKYVHFGCPHVITARITLHWLETVRTRNLGAMLLWALCPAQILHIITQSWNSFELFVFKIILQTVLVNKLHNYKVYDDEFCALTLHPAQQLWHLRLFIMTVLKLKIQTFSNKLN